MLDARYRQEPHRETLVKKNGEYFFVVLFYSKWNI